MSATETTTRIALEEFYQLPDDGWRHELVNGWLVSDIFALYLPA